MVFRSVPLSAPPALPPVPFTEYMAYRICLVSPSVLQGEFIHWTHPSYTSIPGPPSYSNTVHRRWVPPIAINS